MLAVTVLAAIPPPCSAQSDEELDEKLRSLAQEHGITNITITPELRRQARELRDTLGKGMRDQLTKTQGPITFYGRAVDDHERPIAGAEAAFQWNDLSAYLSSLDEKDIKTKSLVLKSDADGRFCMERITAPGLQVRVSMPGFYSSRSNTTLIPYSIGASPGPKRPIVFHLRKKGPGAELITSQLGVAPGLEISGLTDWSAARVNFFSQKVTADGQLEISAVKPRRGQPATNWSFRLSIPDGGLVEEAEEFPFQAPESGYKPTIEFNFRAGDTNWTEKLHKRYYIVFGEPRKYGRIDVETGIYRGVSLSYVVNPGGSRYLEPR